MEAAGDADALVATLNSASGERTHIRGRDARGDVAARTGASEVVAYEAVSATAAPPEIDQAVRGDLTAVAVFSPRTAGIFAQLAPDTWRMNAERLSLYAISAAAAAPLSGFGFGDVVVAETPTADAMRAALCGAAK